jgi:hypothetical protein
MPSMVSLRAKSARPVLSVTLRMARWIAEVLAGMMASSSRDEQFGDDGKFYQQGRGRDARPQVAGEKIGGGDLQW